MTHQSDRRNRKDMEIALMERGILIVNIDNGYFRPDGSKEDMLKAKGYLLREQARYCSCGKRCKAILKCISPPKERKVNDLEKNQISLSEFGIG